MNIKAADQAPATTSPPIFRKCYFFSPPRWLAIQVANSCIDSNRNTDFICLNHLIADVINVLNSNYFDVKALI